MDSCLCTDTGSVLKPYTSQAFTVLTSFPLELHTLIILFRYSSGAGLQRYRALASLE